jgi:hypothetical protein
MKDDEEQSFPGTTTIHLAYAEASVMVLECLMRLLIERKLVSLDDMLEAVDTAIETKRVLSQEGSHPEIARVAAGVLSTLANSLAAGGRPPRMPDPTSSSHS